MAFAAATVRVEEPPVRIEIGAAAMLTVGVSAAGSVTVTVTVACAAAWPALPEAVAVYVVVLEGATV